MQFHHTVMKLNGFLNVFSLT